MKIKVCGMRDPQNIADVAKLKPDYMGFIFFSGSPRCVIGKLHPNDLAPLAPATKRVGVFVNSSAEEVLSEQKQFRLDIVQLHGDEEPQLCEALKAKSPDLQLMKAIAIDGPAAFERTHRYEESCDLLLFDTSLPGERGGTGKTFDWKLLDGYRGEIPFLLSGGIGLENIAEVKELSRKHPLLHGIDINSKVEQSPGMKQVELVEQVIREARR